MMQDVVNEEAARARARLEGYSVAGKTGTASKPERGGDSDSRYVASFVGVVPASAPRLSCSSRSTSREARSGGASRPPWCSRRSRATRSSIRRSLLTTSGSLTSPVDGAARAQWALSPTEVVGDARGDRRPRRRGRRRRPGSLFFRSRLRADGHDFAPAALEHGAVALAVERCLPLDGPQVVVDEARAVMPAAAAAFLGIRRASSRSRASPARPARPRRRICSTRSSTRPAAGPG